MSLRRTGTPEGVAGISYGAFNTKTVSAAGGRRLVAFRSPRELRSRTMTGGTSPRRIVSTAARPPSLRTVPWFDRKVGANLNARYKGLNLDMFYAKTQAPHLTNSSATTSWGRYGISNADQAMVDLGYQRKFSTRWTSSLHATYNHFLEHADYGEIGTREILSNNYLVEWANDLAVTDKVNAVFGANLSKRTGSFYEATYQWYGVPSYDRNNVTAFAQADYRPIPRLKLIAGGQVIKVPGFSTHVTGGQSGEVSSDPGARPSLCRQAGRRRRL